MTKKEKAMSLFLEGYNCTQSLVLAFEEEIGEVTGMERAQLARFVSPLGGGMGRLREVCGSVSGMFLVLGFFYGYDTPGDQEAKAELYARVQELAHRFEEKNGSIVCRELLGLSVKREAPTPEARTPEYYKKRPCKELIGCAAEILEEYIDEQKQTAV